jgi:phosphoribosylglycinamide formyltransferase 1
VKVGVLVSGEGTNLQALLDTVHGVDVEIVAVASDQRSARALDRAVAAGIPTRVFLRSQYGERAARDGAIADWLADRGVELVVLAGYMAILDAAFVARFPERIINVHPSLLPAFPGLRPIEQALDYGVSVFGVTVHLIDEGVDTGPIILQRALELTGARTVEEVHDQLRPIEHELLPRAVALVAAGRVHRDPAHHRRVLIAPSGES